MLGPGYVRFDGNGTPVGVLAGHVFAGWLWGSSVTVYLITGFHQYSQLELLRGDLGDSTVPTLVYVLAAILIGCSLLSGLAFFCDRYRVPVLIVLAAWMVLVSYIPSGKDSEIVREHMFETTRLDSPETLPPLSAGFDSDDDDRIILVCAAGGGIQAGAWTAQVLNGLSQELGEKFDSHVRAISSVSGGSVGTMFYVASRLHLLDPQAAIQAAAESSLEAIGWGLVHPDLQRTLLPEISIGWMRRDRGWALERMLAWRAHMAVAEDKWALRRLARPDLPVLILNSTSARLGDATVFSNSRFPDTSTQKLADLAPGIENFHTTHRRDVRLETAVRMSATFPYVSPAARAYMPTSEYLVDGGYYDNLGLSSMVAWVRQSIAGVPIERLKRKRILLIETIGFPESMESTPTSKNWFYQLGAPLNAMLNARETGQLKRDQAEEALTREALGGRTEWTAPTVVFRYDLRGRSPDGDACPANPPLSWHLTYEEKRCVCQAWLARGEEIRQVREFLAMPQDQHKQNGKCEQ